MTYADLIATASIKARLMLADRAGREQARQERREQKKRPVVIAGQENRYG